jgi:hypothetical protein
MSTNLEEHTDFIWSIEFLPIPTVIFCGVIVAIVVLVVLAKRRKKVWEGRTIALEWMPGWRSCSRLGVIGPAPLSANVRQHDALTDFDSRFDGATWWLRITNAADC